jgi:hypothetical protein
LVKVARRLQDAALQSLLNAVAAGRPLYLYRLE